MKLSDLIILERDREDATLNKTPKPGGLGPYLTTAQAATILGVTQSRVRQFIMDGRLKAYSPEKGRRDNMLKSDEVHAFKNKKREITGRPEGT